MRWLWLAAALLLGVAAFAIYRSFSSPAFVAGLMAVAMGAVWKAILPGFKPRDMTEAERQKFRQGESIATKAHGHGGESR